MTDTKDGGPACPSEQGHIPDGTWNQTFERGMSVRQRYKVAALSGLLSDSSVAGRIIREPQEGGSPHIQHATDVIGLIADAMLAEDQEFAEKLEAREKNDG